FSAPMLLNRVSRCRARHERELLAGLAPSTRCAEMDFAGLTSSFTRNISGAVFDDADDADVFMLVSCQVDVVDDVDVVVGELRTSGARVGSFSGVRCWQLLQQQDF
ncbi:hypothetical protein LXT12_26380, partial [Pelomonas sp. P7]